MSYSRKAYSEAVFHQTTENFIRCLENAFRPVTEVAKVLNLDNLRAAAQKADWLRSGNQSQAVELLSSLRLRVAALSA